jgi:hypothetical protein
MSPRIPSSGEGRSTGTENSMKISRRLAALACFALLSALPAAKAQTFGIPTAPLLRIEAGTHQGQFRSSAFDATGRFYLTSAQDRTARLWDLRDGRLLAVLRPPSDGAELGTMGAVALSPDGKEAAVAFSGVARNLFIFSTTGAFKTSTLVPGGNIHALEYTADGKWLIAAAAKSLERLDAATLASKTLLPGRYAFDVNARQNTLAFFSFKADGTNTEVFTCAIDLSRPCRAIADPGDKYIPRSFNLTPDGRTVFYALNQYLWGPPPTDKYVTEVRDAATGALKLRRDGNLPQVFWDNIGNAFTVDGATLRRYSVVDLQPGAVVAQIPRYRSFGSLIDGKLRYLQENGLTLELALLDTARGAASTTGAVVTRPLPSSDAAAFNIAVLAERGVRFSAPGKTSSCASMSPFNAFPMDERVKMIANYKAGTCPDVMRMPDGSVVQSARFRLKRYGTDGRILWDVQHSANQSWGMAPSTDARWIGVRSEDGTLRLMTAAEGREVLAVFEQGKRWVMSTPSGYYDASPAGEGLIGWQVNRGAEAPADYFPSSRFRAQLMRPDVVAKVFETGDEATALQQANAEAGRKPPQASVSQVLPPVVEIVSPAGGAAVAASPLVVKYTLRAPADAPVTALRVRVNGQAVDLPDARTLVVTAAAGVRELSIPVPQQDSEVQVFAENRNGVSTPAVVRVSWKGAEPSKQPDFQVKPKLYVLAVGVSDYDNPQYKLGLAAKDAQDFAAALQKQKGALYRDVEVKLLTNKAATRDEVLDGLEWLRKQVTARDVGMLFLAGHGFNDADGVYYFMPVNADLDKLKRTGVVFTEIKNTLANLAGKALFFVDTCHSGNILGGGRRAIANDMTSMINELASAENGVVVFSSSTGRQYSLEDAAWGNGAFTKALVEGLNGKADMGKNGRITHKMLDFYLSERVKELTKGQQTPVTQAPGGVPDFPVAVVR